MITGKKKTHIKVFTGSPWEIASITKLLTSAYINVKVEDGKKDIHLSVPTENYSAAVRLISNRN